MLLVDFILTLLAAIVAAAFGARYTKKLAVQDQRLFLKSEIKKRMICLFA